MKKTIAIGLIGMTALSVGAAAHGGWMQNTEIQSAVEAGDYDSFVESLSAIDSQAADRMNEDMFERIQNRFQTHQEVQEAMDNEDYEAFIEATGGEMTEDEFEDMVARHNAHEAIELAVEAGDYDAWVEAISGLPHGADMADIVDEDEFEKFIEIHDDREDRFGGHTFGGLGMKKSGQHGMV